jgi:hypothetical protein
MEAQPELPRPRASAARAPARKALGSGAAAHGAAAGRRSGVAQAPIRALATQRGALAEKPEDDQWTEL